MGIIQSPIKKNINITDELETLSVYNWNLRVHSSMNLQKFIVTMLRRWRSWKREKLNDFIRKSIKNFFKKLEKQRK